MLVCVPRLYRRRSESLSRLLKYVSDYQAAHGVAPSSLRAIGKAIGTSHTQANRLLKAAVQGQLLVRDANGAIFQRVLPKASPRGIKWVPKIDASWTREIEWKVDPGYGAWLDVDLHRLQLLGDPWLVRFTTPVGGRTPHLNLTHEAWALVDRAADKPINDCWYAFGFEGYTDVGCLSIAGGLWFVNSRRRGGDVRVPKSSVRKLAQIVAVIRPLSSLNTVE